MRAPSRKKAPVSEKGSKAIGMLIVARKNTTNKPARADSPEVPLVSRKAGANTSNGYG